MRNCEFQKIIQAARFRQSTKFNTTLRNDRNSLFEGNSVRSLLEQLDYSLLISSDEMILHSVSGLYYLELII